ncbi:MAG: 2-isopropylmalate synthase, partial [Oscillospiraceae bacterium]
ASNDTEYDFCRTLIENNIIPNDVTIQVLTQSREHIIEKTFNAIKGAKNVIIHLYNSTSYPQREQVFKKSKDEIKKIATEGAALVLNYSKKYNCNFTFEYSPESFTATEMEFALDVCNSVCDLWQNQKVIINLPVTVAHSMSHIYACQVEYICKNLNNRENIIISVHPHNDRGSAVADAEMGLLAGANRVEGTLFGNGERTGNVDLITLALNLFSQGIDPKLNFTNMPEICAAYEEMTSMKVYERQPYSGKLVFAAFSGSHQDAIAKSMKWHEKNKKSTWNVPYLPIDPEDIGRQYEGDVIRINSQSGKGGISFLLQQQFGFELPPQMGESFSHIVKSISDKKQKELLPDEVVNIFTKEYINISHPIKISQCHFEQKDKIMKAIVNASINNEIIEFSGTGNGRLDAISNGIKQYFKINYSIIKYTEHALEQGSNSQAVAYVGIKLEDETIVWGAGIDEDIMTASINALVSCINKILN